MAWEDLGWEVRLSKRSVEKAEAHAKERYKDLSVALAHQSFGSPTVVQSHLLLGPGGRGIEAATDQAKALSRACLKTHKAFPSKPDWASCVRGACSVQGGSLIYGRVISAGANQHAM